VVAATGSHACAAKQQLIDQRFTNAIVPPVTTTTLFLKYASIFNFVAQT
jgi:hypothetical protein